MKVPSYLPILVFAALNLLACKRNTSMETKGNLTGALTEINGSIRAGEAEPILLEEMGAREYIPIDTSVCDTSGAFHIDFLADKIAFYVLRYGQSGYTTLLIEPGEKLLFSGDLNAPSSYTVSGSPGSELLRDLAIVHKKTLDALGEIGRLSRENISSPEYAKLKMEWDNQFDSIAADFREYSLEFIHKHAHSPAILISLYNLYGQGLPVFSPQTDLEVYQFVDSVLMKSYGDLEAVQLLHAQVTEAKQILGNDLSVPGLQKGQIAPDFVSSRPDGSDLALSDLKGNYVLLGFWAGWSSLSREENATLKQAMERYTEKNFKILQVSVDDNRETWIGAIEEDGLAWEHVSDLKRWETPVVNIYQVEKIPYSLIIDPSGKVVGTNLYGEEFIKHTRQFIE